MSASLAAEEEEHLQVRVRNHLELAARLDAHGHLDDAAREYDAGLEAMVALMRGMDSSSSMFAALKKRARAVWERSQQIQAASQRAAALPSPAADAEEVTENYGATTVTVRANSAERRAERDEELRERDCEVLLAVEPACLFRLPLSGEPELLHSGRLHVLRAVVDARVLGHNYSGIWHVNREGSLASLVFVDFGKYQIPLTPFIPVLRSSRQHFLFPTAQKDVYWAFEFPLDMTDQELDAVELSFADHCVFRRSYGYDKWRRDRDRAEDPAAVAAVEDGAAASRSMPEGAAAAAAAAAPAADDVSLRDLASDLQEELRAKDSSMDRDSGAIMAEFQTSIPAQAMYNLIDSFQKVTLVDVASAINEQNHDWLLRIARETGMEDAVQAVRNRDYDYLMRAVGDRGVQQFLDACRDSGVPAMVEAVKHVDVEGLRNAARSGDVRGVIRSIRDSNFGDIYSSVRGVQKTLPAALLENFNLDNFLSFARDPQGFVPSGPEMARAVVSRMGYNMVHPDRAYGQPLEMVAGAVHGTFDGVERGVEIATDFVNMQMDATCDFIKSAVGTNPVNIKIPLVVKLPFRITAKITPVARLLSNALVGGLANFAAGIILVIKGILVKSGLIGENSMLQNASRTLYSGADASAGLLFGVARTLVALENAGRNIAAHFGDKVVEMTDWTLGEDAGEIARDTVEITRDLSMTTYNLYMFSISSVFRGAAKGVAKNVAKDAAKLSAKSVVASYYFQIKKERAAQREAEKIRRFIDGSQAGQYIEERIYDGSLRTANAIRMIRSTASAPVFPTVAAAASSTAVAAAAPDVDDMSKKRKK